MLRLLRSRKAQNTAEYALLITIVIGVFGAMQLYVKRGMQARLQGGMDTIPDVILNNISTSDTNVHGLGIFGNETQYEPYYYAQGAYNMSTVSSEGTETGTINATSSAVSGVRNLTGAYSTRTGTQTVTGAN